MQDEDIDNDTEKNNDSSLSRLCRSRSSTIICHMSVYLLRIFLNLCLFRTRQKGHDRIERKDKTVMARQNRKDKTEKTRQKGQDRIQKKRKKGQDRKDRTE